MILVYCGNKYNNNSPGKLSPPIWGPASHLLMCAWSVDRGVSTGSDVTLVRILADRPAISESVRILSCLSGILII